MSDFLERHRKAKSKKSVFNHESSKVNSNGEQAVFDSLSTKEEQEEELSKKIKKTALGSIMTGLEYISRPFYSVSGAINVGAKSLKGDIKLDRVDNELFDAIKGGLTGEEKIDLRDTLKYIAPKTMRAINEQTKFKILGIEGDALSIPLFIAEIPLDPLSWVGSSAVRGVKKSTSLALDTITNTAKKIDPVFTEKALKKMGDAQDVIYDYTNIKGLFKKYLGSDKEAEALIRSSQKANAKSQNFNEKLRFLGLNSEKDAIVLNDALQKVSDKEIDVLTNYRARVTGSNVNDVVFFDNISRKMNDIDKIKSGDVSGNAVDLLKEKEIELSEIIKNAKKIENPSFIKKVLEERGYKNEAKSIAKLEQLKTIELAKTKIKYAKESHAELKKIIKKRKENIISALKGDLNGASSLVKESAGTTISVLKNIQNQVQKSTKGILDINTIKESFDFVDKSLDQLSKYEDVLLKTGFKSQKSPLIKAMVVNIKNNIDKASKATTKAERNYVLKEVSKQFQYVADDLKSFSKKTNIELSNLKNRSDDASNIIKSAAKNLEKDLYDLDSWEKGIDKMFFAEKINFANAVTKSKEIVRKRADQIYKNIRIFEKYDANNEAIKAFKKYESQVEDELIKELVPENLRDVAREVRSFFNNYQKDLRDSGVLKGYIPGYFPRQVVKKDIEKLNANIFSGAGGEGSGFFKAREFLKQSEAQDFAQKKGIKFEEDANLIIHNYIHSVEKRKAKKLLEDKVLEGYGLSSFSEAKKLSQDQLKSLRLLRENIEYLYNGDKRNYPKAIKHIMKAYNSTTGLLKSILTVWNPAYHGINLISQPFLIATESGLKGASKIGNYVDGIRMKSGTLDKLTRNINGKTESIDFKTLSKQIEDSGLLGGSFQSVEGLIPKNLNFKRYSWNNPMRFIAEYAHFSQNVDDFGRLSALAANWKNGDDVATSIQKAMKSQIDYNMANSPVDKAMQGIFAFYSFRRRNLPNQIENMFKNPHHYSLMSRAVEKLSNREMLNKEELGLLNTYEQSSLMVLGDMVNGVRDIYSMNMMPINDAYNALNSILSFDSKALMVSPALSTFLDYYYSTDSFIGKEFGNQLPARYTNVIKGRLRKVLNLKEVEKPKYRNGEKVGTEKVLVGPTNSIFLVRRIPVWSRQLNDISKAIETYKGGDPLAATIGYFLGVRKQEFDKPQREFFKNQEKENILREQAKSKGAKELYPKVFIPKYMKEKQ